MTQLRVLLTALAVALGAPLAVAQDAFPSSGPRQGESPNGPQPSSVPQQLGGSPPASAGNVDQQGQAELADFGVRPTGQLYDGQMHAPTPTSIPGGKVVTTKELAALVQGNQAPYFLFDVLGGPQQLPGAIAAAGLSTPGTFTDQIQQQFAQMLQQGTQGRKDIALVFYCLSNECWMSYNAALRAINAGYTNVLWYRGGIEAWSAAGLPTQQSQPGFSTQR